MNFASPSRQGHMLVDLRMLHKIMRLPADVQITGIRPHPEHAGQCIVDLQGDLPQEGCVEPQYGYEHTTIITFRGWAP